MTRRLVDDCVREMLWDPAYDLVIELDYEVLGCLDFWEVKERENGRVGA